MSNTIFMLMDHGIDPGEHVHAKENPLGLHSHEKSKPMSGAHIHTPQNPMGEHFHGPLAGMALADGAHVHDNGSMGLHFHKNDIPPNIVNISNPRDGSILETETPNS